MAILRASRLILIAWCSFLPQVFVNGQCYYPNGDLSSDGDKPCSSNGDGPCCPLNWTCLSNGLCYLENENYLGRYTCTDQSWHSSSCPNICTHDNTASGNEAVNECSPGNYCCDANRPEISDPPGPGCCDTSSDKFPLPDLGANSPSAAKSSTSDTTSAQTSSTDVPILVPSSTASSSTDTPTSNTSSEDTSKIETTSEASSITQATLSPTSAAASETSESNAISPPVTVISTSIKSATGKTDASPSPSAITSIVLLTSVVVNSVGSSTSIFISKTVESQSTSSSLPVIAQTSSSKNLGMKIGVGVGVPIGILALALFGFLLWRLGRKHQSRPRLGDNALPVGVLDPEYMYKGNADLGTPATATTISPDLNKRASSKYVVSDAEEGKYRGVQTGGLGLHPVSAEFSNPATESELSGTSPLPSDARNSQMSELAGSRYHPSELAERAYR